MELNEVYTLTMEFLAAKPLYILLLFVAAFIIPIFIDKRDKKF